MPIWSFHVLLSAPMHTMLAKNVTDTRKSYLSYVKKDRINVLRRRRLSTRSTPFDSDIHPEHMYDFFTSSNINKQ